MVDQDMTFYLAGDATASVTNAQRGQLDAIRTVLADPAVWAQPDPRLEDKIVAAIDAELRFAPPSDGRPARLIRYLFLGVAAALVIAGAVAVGLTRYHSTTLVAGGGSATATTYAAELAGTPLAVEAAGQATLTQTASGWQIQLHASGLPRRDGVNFYEAWLKNGAGVLVPIGTFNEPAQVTLWAGVSPADFLTLTVTQQQANGNPASSGRVVLKGLAQPDK